MNYHHILFNTCLAFTSLLVMFLLINETCSGCKAILFFMTFALISYFTWINIEAHFFYTQLLQKFDDRPMSSSLLSRLVVGLGVPLVISLFVFADDTNMIIRNDHGDAQFCFVDVNTDLGVIVFLPMGLALTINGVIFVLVGRKLYVEGKKKTKKELSVVESVVAGIKIAGSLSAVLGVTWFLALFYLVTKATNNNEATTAMEYVMVIGILLQGFLMVYFHCFRNKEVKQFYSSKLFNFSSTASAESTDAFATLSLKVNEFQRRETTTNTGSANPNTGSTNVQNTGSANTNTGSAKKDSSDEGRNSDSGVGSGGNSGFVRGGSADSRLGREGKFKIDITRTTETSAGTETTTNSVIVVDKSSSSETQSQFAAKNSNQVLRL